MSVVWQSARATLGVGLLALLVWGVGDERSGEEVVRVTAAASVAELATALASRPAAGIVFADSIPPSHGVSRLLRGAAARGRAVSLVVPGVPPALEVTVPVVTIAKRRSALTLTVRAPGGTDVPVIVRDGSGVGDTVTVSIGDEGVVVATVAIEPSRAGPNQWIVTMGADSVAAASWTRPESPVASLVLSGSPSWEMRAVLRALEAGGGHVATWSDIGRGLSLGSEDAVVPTTLAELADFDVLVLVGSVPGMSTELVRRWVKDFGGGLLIIEESLADGGSVTQRVAGADDLGWSGPAEIVPLPSTDLKLVVRTTPLTAGTEAVAFLVGEPEATLSTVEWLGRGRIFRSGVETWPFVLEAGLGAEHAAYWESVVEWLASGIRGDRYVSGPASVPHGAWAGRIYGEVPDTVTVSAERGPPVGRLEVVRGSDSVGVMRFVPTSVGTFTFGGGLDAGLRTVSATGRSSWVDAALEMGGAGGEIVILGRSGLDDVTGPTIGGSTPWRLPVFLLLSAVALLGWAVRRMEGLA
ncbi:MAG: hypothetical protein GWP44_01070 [Proteobacteria bacterium]|nr:hypothetical protein [Pseudomonadota bacterium]